MHIAYLGPEIPALSATFIYEELLGLERRGIRVTPFSVMQPAHPATDQAALAARTRVLYDKPAVRIALEGLAALPMLAPRIGAALALLLHDMAAVGPWRAMAWKLGYQWLAGARLARELQATGCSHLHVHFAHTATQIGMYAAAFAGLPFTTTAHANDIFERGLLLPEKAERSRKLVTISRYNLDYLRSIGVAPDKLAVVRCGVSFAPRADRPTFASKPVYRIGTLCRLVEKKGIDDLIRAVALIDDAPWRLELSIAGDGPQRDALVALVRELQLADRVRFVGALEHRAVTEWLRALDAFALPCKKDSNGDMDGIPVVLMEAMSQRVPVVSTRLTGIPELVVDDRTGLLASPDDPTSLATALRRLFHEPGLRARLSEAAVAHVQAEFGQQVNLDRLLECFTPQAVLLRGAA